MSQDGPEEAMLDPSEAAEEIMDDGDATMDSDEGEQAEELEIQLQNDSLAYCDAHAGNSIFCIAQHPTRPTIVATGGGEDEEEKEVGVGFVFDVDAISKEKNETGTSESKERESIKPLASLTGHTDSIAAIAFTRPRGEFLVTGGLDGRLIAHRDISSSTDGTQWTHHATVQEVEEINWLAACPHPSYPNVVALGASDGSVWVYTIADTSSSSEDALTIVQTYYVHTGSCTAGAWTPDGNLLVTVADDSSLCVWDVWGAAAGAGLTTATAQAAVTLSSADDRFRVDGGLFSIAVAPSGAYVAVGGAEGHIRVVGLPRLDASTTRDTGKATGAGGVGKGVKSKGSAGASSATGGGAGQAGAILASLKAQSGSIETLAFSPLPTASSVTSGGGVSLLAAGSVDGSIVLFDAGRNFAVRRTIAAAEAADEGEGEGEAIVQIEFVKAADAGAGWLLTSAGYDGVLRRWDVRGGQHSATGAAPGGASNRVQGLLGEWKGHRGGGDGGGIMGFVQGIDGGNKVVTAGDDGVALVFDMTALPKSS